ncbi:MAG: class I SAM-dependent DNA methyltransferase, partial [Chloroflexi bacterium]|nr:class I SAM-dependent DNA methyltransferase [Chloroflexota bacterium]
TNSIRGGQNRAVLDRIAEHGTIYDAWSDEDWVVDGAAVRVSLICFGAGANTFGYRLNGDEVRHIHSDLSAGAEDLSTASKLSHNRKKAFIGVNKTGAFDVPGETARAWLCLPRNPNGGAIRTY